MAQRQPVVNFREQFGHLSGVLRLHLAFKAVHLVHGLAFVITASHEEVIRIQ